MKTKKVYLINRMQLVDLGEPLGDTYMPDFSAVNSLFEGYHSGSEDDHWDAHYSDDDFNGVPEQALVGIYTTEENHAILEKDPDFKRVDNIDKTEVDKIKDKNKKLSFDSIDQLKVKRA